MRFIKTHLLEISILTVLGIIYFATRLYHLTSLPIFTDEAIYLRWAQIAGNDASWRFISLTDGKQPLFIWLIMPMLRLFKDPLMAGRMISVIAGFFSMLGLFFVGKELFRNKWVGIFSALLYLIYPMALVYDKMALYDTLVGTFTIWALYLQILLVRYIRLDIAFILSFVLGGAMLTKTNGFFSAAFLPFTLLLFDWQRKDRIKKLLEWGIYGFLAVFIAYIYYSVLRLSPFFYIIDEKNATFVYPIGEWLQHPFLGFTGNITVLLPWLSTYLTLPIILLILLSFFVQRSYFKEKVLLFLLFLIPFIYYAFFGKVIYPRHFFAMTLSLLPLGAFTLSVIFAKVKRPLIYIPLFLVIGFLALRSDYYLLTDFFSAPIPASDLEQYGTGWPAGGGVREAVALFEEKAAKGPIYIATQGTFGLMPYALELYLVDNPNVTIKGVWPINEQPPQEVINASKKKPTYILFYQPCSQVGCEQIGGAPKSWPLKKILQIPKNKNIFLSVYEVINN